MFDIIKRLKDLREEKPKLDNMGIYDILKDELEAQQMQRRLERLLLANNAHKALTYFMN